jgi:cell wall-associated NlpC family hydrolase
MNSGHLVKHPKYGDIVGFKYPGASVYYHVGIYISDDTMLHSGGKRGDRTEFRSISNFAGNYSSVSYSRLVETN